MDKFHSRYTAQLLFSDLEYRLPDDRRSFWSGKYPTAGSVQGFMCENCGRIALYGGPSES
jgi:hypothetical protein